MHQQQLGCWTRDCGRRGTATAATSVVQKGFDVTMLFIIPVIAIAFFGHLLHQLEDRAKDGLAGLARGRAKDGLAGLARGFE
jgi:hypothetical protein